MFLFCDYLDGGGCSTRAPAAQDDAWPALWFGAYNRVRALLARRRHGTLPTNVPFPFPSRSMFSLRLPITPVVASVGRDSRDGLGSRKWWCLTKMALFQTEGISVIQDCRHTASAENWESDCRA